MTHEMKSSSNLKAAGSLFLLMFLILAGCEKEGVSNKEQKILFDTIWKMDRVDYYLDGELVKSIEYNSDNALYVHYFDDLSLWLYAEKGKYGSYIQPFSISDLHITLYPNMPERVITSINKSSMVIETDGLEHIVSTDILEYDHSVSYYSAAKKSPLASSFEGEWENYKMELYNDGKITKTWEVVSRIKYSKDGRITYQDPQGESLKGKYYLLIDDKVAFSVSNLSQSVYTVSISGKEMVQEGYSSLGTTKNYFCKVK